MLRVVAVRWFIELCCGSAGLSKAFAAAGFSVTAVDKASNVHRTKVHVLSIDLTSPEGQQQVFDMLRSGHCVLPHSATLRHGQQGQGKANFKEDEGPWGTATSAAAI